MPRVVFRPRPRTSTPIAAKSRATRPPRNPVAPVTRTGPVTNRRHPSARQQFQVWRPAPCGRRTPGSDRDASNCRSSLCRPVRAAFVPPDLSGKRMMCLWRPLLNSFDHTRPLFGTRIGWRIRRLVANHSVHSPCQAWHSRETANLLPARAAVHHPSGRFHPSRWRIKHTRHLPIPTSSADRAARATGGGVLIHFATRTGLVFRRDLP